MLDALDAETPPPAPEIAWLFRQFCEEAARERPLVLVFDDVHWAEPTFLELVEHLADKGTGPISVVCLAREELLEERSAFLEERANADRVVLDALSSDETDALLEGLGGTILESDQRARVVAAAEGNPLFLEQLLALALEGGLAERALPETIQALLAARLDRLGPGERAVLERGAVVGKEFAAGRRRRAARSGCGADGRRRTYRRSRPWVRPAARRGRLRLPPRPRAGGRLPRRAEAPARGAPRALRRPARHDVAGPPRARRVRRLPPRAGVPPADRARRVGSADARGSPRTPAGGSATPAFARCKRGDMSATVSLLDARRRFLLLRRRGSARAHVRARHRAAREGQSRAATRRSSMRSSTRRAWRRSTCRAARAHRAAYVRITLHPEPDETADLAEERDPDLRGAEDDRSLGRAWLLIGCVQGGRSRTPRGLGGGGRACARATTDDRFRQRPALVRSRRRSTGGRLPSLRRSTRARMSLRTERSNSPDERQSRSVSRRSRSLSRAGSTRRASSSRRPSDL